MSYYGIAARMRTAAYSVRGLGVASFFFAGAAFAVTLVAPQAAQAQQAAGCSGTSVPLDISFALEPFVRMKLGGREGNFLIDTGADDSHIDTSLFGLPAQPHVKIQGSSLPTLDEGVFIAQDLSHHQKSSPVGGYAGAIGTNILKSRVVAFHYNAAKPYLVLSKQPCSPLYFEQAGYVPISQKGFYGPNASGPSSGTPVIYAQIGSVRMQVWIDTGAGNPTSKHMVVQINDAVFQKLRAAGITMKPAGSVTLTDCKGTQSDDKLWQIESVPLAFTNEQGQSLFEYAPPTLQVRNKSQCGLIGDRSEPLATIGALMIARWGTVIFDGPNEKVWVTKNRFPVSFQAAYKSIVMARDEGNVWAASTSNVEESAKTASLSSCKENSQNCKIDTVVSQNQFLCLAVVKNSAGRRWKAMVGSLADARKAALDSCTQQGGADCKLEYSACND